MITVYIIISIFSIILFTTVDDDSNKELSKPGCDKLKDSLLRIGMGIFWPITILIVIFNSFRK